MTKLAEILKENNMTQQQLITLIETRCGRVVGKDRISRICSGKLTNYSMATANLIATALGIKVDDFIETDKLTNLSE